MRVGSLFSGIGGLDLGLERAGHELVFCAESDAYRRRVLDARFGVPVFDDVRTVTLGAGPVDLVAGGFPCQDLSVAGNRAGLAGERSGLFSEFARVADALRPGWILIENVPGLFSSNGGRDFGIVLGTLADLGYGLAWRTLDSRYFGVPQRRRRVFILGTLAIDGARSAAERAGTVLAIGARCGRHIGTRGKATEDVAYALADGSGSRTGSGRDAQDTYVVTTVADTIGGRRGFTSDDVDRGGALVVAVSENQRAEVLETPYAHQLSSGGGKPGQGYAMIRDDLSVRRLTPRECERLQGLPDDWTDLGGTRDAPRYNAIGDAVTVNVAEWIGRRLQEAV